MGNVSKRVKYGRYYYLEYFLVGFLTELCLFILVMSFLVVPLSVNVRLIRTLKKLMKIADLPLQTVEPGIGSDNVGKCFPDLSIGCPRFQRI